MVVQPALSGAERVPQVQAGAAAGVCWCTMPCFAFSTACQGCKPACLLARMCKYSGCGVLAMRGGGAAVCPADERLYCADALMVLVREQGCCSGGTSMSAHCMHTCMCVSCQTT
jgi:hypothetical protein